MRFQTLGNVKQFGSAEIMNVDTVAIKDGAPVFYKMGATKMGRDCVSVEGLAAANQIIFAGIAMAEIAVDKYGSAFAYGIAEGVRFISVSRSATNAAWGSVASRAIGDVIIPNSNSGAQHPQAFEWQGNTLLASSASLASNVTIPSIPAVENVGLEGRVRLAQSIASIASEASNSDATDAAHLFRTTTITAMLRAL